jgi:hypothetical protein
MQFFFPDSQDQVSPYFDFTAEEHPVHRVRQRDDRYAHEALSQRPYDGILISKSIVDGEVGGGAKYTVAQRQRVYRYGAHHFFRADEPERLPIIGDCGAFTYVQEDEPPYSISEVVGFYEGLGLDAGVSMDHIPFGYLNAAKRKKGVEPDAEWIRRRELTISLAGEFLDEVQARKRPFEPIGVAHGWDPASYEQSVRELEAQGYRRIALGGLVPLRTDDLVEVVRHVLGTKRRGTHFHLLGVTRTEAVSQFVGEHAVSSFDSTSPFRQAFMDAKDNYYVDGRTYMALRIPQSAGNAGLKRRIAAGQLDQRSTMAAERHCLETVRAYARGDGDLDDAVDALCAYERIHDTKGTDRSEPYRETLVDRPWEHCRCGICDDVGIEVVIFRGSERNKRRGFHNLSVFRRRLDGALAVAT